MERKIYSFDEFISDTEFHSAVDNGLVEEANRFLINEEMTGLDMLKNTISKSLLGSLSYIKMIDELVDKVFSLEKELLVKQYTIEEEIDELDLKMGEARRADDQTKVKELKRKKDRKLDEMDAFYDAQKLKIKEGLSLIDKTANKSRRRKEYVKAKMAEKELKLAEFRYDYARKKSSDTDKVKEFKKKVDTANDVLVKLSDKLSGGLKKMQKASKIADGGKKI